MPYVGNTYVLPAVYLAIPGTTIVAVQHNVPLVDLQDAQNFARPISGGGTGSNNAAGALTNLGAAGTGTVNQFTATQSWSKGVDIVSATALTLGTDGNYWHVTGTTTVTSITTKPSGTWIMLEFDAALILTHNATDLILPGGANIVTAAGDVAILVSEGTNMWRMASYQRVVAPPPVVSAWVAYTPILTGFGTATNVEIWSRRVGGSLEVRGRFAAGTATAVEARMSLGFNGTEGNVTSSAAIANPEIGGSCGQSTVGAASAYTLIRPSVGYVAFSLQSAGRNSETAVNGDALATGGARLLPMASVPITGWS